MTEEELAKIIINGCSDFIASKVIHNFLDNIGYYDNLPSIGFC